MAGHEDLEIYKVSFELSLRVHRVTLSLPKFELYEEGSQARRSSKPVPANIVEGFALRKYRNEYLHYLYRAYGSFEETIFHPEALFQTGSLTNQKEFTETQDAYRKLAGKIFEFNQTVEGNYSTLNFLGEPEERYDPSCSSTDFDSGRDTGNWKQVSLQ